MNEPASTSERLRILSLVEGQDVAETVRRVFSQSGDEILSLVDLAEVIPNAQILMPDLVFLDVSMQQSAGLSLVHHIKAVAPTAEVVALVHLESLGLGAHALSLGAVTVLVYPPTGDELLLAARSVRERRAASRLRTDLQTRADAIQHAMVTALRIAGLAGQPRTAALVQQVLELFREATGSAHLGLYLAGGEGSEELRRVGVYGELNGAETFASESDLFSAMEQHRIEVVPLKAGQISSGYLVFGGGSPQLEASVRPYLALLATQTANVLALANEREKGGRSAIKDPESSAYTFAYFVDVAGREIDKAERHNRRFSLATVLLDSPDALDVAARSSPLEVAEVMLSAIRDSDILARVDEREFYLLLPETGGVGAHSCLRRLLKTTYRHEPSRNAPRLRGVTVGMATYPHDGTNLSKLLRVAKRRAETSKRSVFHRLRLDRMALPEIVDSLLWDSDIAQGRVERSLESPRALELPLVDAGALIETLVEQACRGGDTLIAVTQREGLDFLSAVKNHLGYGREQVVLRALDIRRHEGCADLEALAVIAEHGAYALLGRASQGSLHGVHASDTLLAHLVMDRLANLSGVRIME